MKKILIAGAHPDDLEYGCGGLCMKAWSQARDSIRIAWMVMTEGGAGGDTMLRYEEQMKAYKMASVDEYFSGAYRDTDLGPLITIIDFIEKRLSIWNPDELYLPSPNDTHQDHRMLTEAGLIAGRWLGNILFYEGYGTYDFSPDIFIELTEKDVEAKLSLLACHQSQIEKTRAHFDMLESAKATARFRGFQAKTNWAEAYKVFRMRRELL